MKKSVWITLVFFFIITNSHAQSASSEIQDLRDNYFKALKTSNTKGILKVYSDDAAIHHVDGTMLNGTKEIKGFYDEFFDNSKASISFKNISQDELAKDLVFYHDNVYLNIEGEDETQNIEVVNIAKKINGKWRVIKSYRWPNQISKF